jgi:hypothetical protein
MDEIAGDAADLLSPEVIVYRTSGGARFAEDVPDELAFPRKRARELDEAGAA